jgi:hypothetical protein
MGIVTVRLCQSWLEYALLPQGWSIVSQRLDLLSPTSAQCRLYRVVQATAFLQAFASDRSHMMDGEGGYQQAPPAYPCIMAPSGAIHTLPRYVDMSTPQDALAGACGPGVLQPHHSRAAGGAEGRKAIEDASRQPFGVVLAEPQFVAIFGG